MLLDVCCHACNVACSSFLMYSAEICASAVQFFPRGKDLPSQTITPQPRSNAEGIGAEGDRKDKANHRCMLCRSEQSWERAAHSSLHQSFMVPPPWQWGEERLWQRRCFKMWVTVSTWAVILLGVLPCGFPQYTSLRLLTAPAAGYSYGHWPQYQRHNGQRRCCPLWFHRKETDKCIFIQKGNGCAQMLHSGLKFM